jgi:fructan beta-fructosidase
MQAYARLVRVISLMFTSRMKFFLLAMLASTLLAHAAAPDIVVADFEGADYGDWKISGDAFGAGPAQGAVQGQMPVSGFAGKGFVNSFHGGDDTTGSMVSPPFKIQRRFLRFLIGGGNYPDETCINLLAAGRVVRTATGANSEHLEPQQWDLADLSAQDVTIEIVDRRKGGWGHVNIDHIVQTDASLPRNLKNPAREIRVEKKFLNLPVKNGAPKKMMTIKAGGKIVRQFTIELADAEPDWWAFLDLAPFHNQALSISTDKLKEDSKAFAAIEQSDQIKGGENLYNEKLRPQFHFTARRGWNNDPNGLVFYKGEYHLFFQHNPYGWNWGNMHWGHAVSRDLVHWTELDEALYPDELGTMFSGSAVIDEHNTAGFQKGSEKTLVVFYTAAGGDSPLSNGKQFSQCLAYSNDRGRTWTKYEKNPVLPHIVGGNRDPKVLWYAPENKWLLALYLDQNDYAIFDSKDLKSWNQLSKVTIPGTSECPEFFEIPVEGQNETRWIFYGGNGRYLIGKFDGKNFTAESGPHELNHGNCFYASQTYNLPANDKRRILVPWGQINIPGMPFNQMIGLPVELKLKSTPQGLHLCALPLKALESLRTQTMTPLKLRDHVLKAGGPGVPLLPTDLLEVETEIAVAENAEVRFAIHGALVTYDAAKKEISCLGKKASLTPINGKIRLRLLIDRASIDIFGNDGALYMPMGFTALQDDRTGSISSHNGDATLVDLKQWALKSSWVK